MALKMKLGSINLHCLQEENQNEKSLRIAKLIKELDLDVCFFQEVAQSKDSPIVVDNIKEDCNLYPIYKELKDNYHFYYEHKKYGFDIYEEGLALCSKYPLLEKDFYYISKSRDTSWLTRIVVRSKIKVNDEEIGLYTVHMGWDFENEKYFDQVDLLVDGIKDKNFILSGDFNAYYGSKEYNYLVGKGLKSTTDLYNIDPNTNPTFAFSLDFNNRAANRHIDYFFTSNHIRVLDYKILLKEENQRVSDHYFIYNEIEWRK